jgi:hypothetical protein
MTRKPENQCWSCFHWKALLSWSVSSITSYSFSLVEFWSWNCWIEEPHSAVISTTRVATVIALVTWSDGFSRGNLLPRLVLELHRHWWPIFLCGRTWVRWSLIEYWNSNYHGYHLLIFPIFPKVQNVWLLGCSLYSKAPIWASPWNSISALIAFPSQVPCVFKILI